MSPASASALRPGEIVVDHASRAFSIRADRGGTLKELILRRRAAGPAPIQALDDVSLTIPPGQTVGIDGRNGAGKSSTLKVLAGIVPLDAGSVTIGGRIVSLLELGAGFGRDFSGRENILLGGALHGLTKVQIEARMDDIIAFSELGDFIDVPVKTYSSGMYVRLGFAISAHLDADVLLIDEVLAVGDEAFQRKCEAQIARQVARARRSSSSPTTPTSSSAPASASSSSTAAASSSTGPRARAWATTTARWGHPSRTGR